MRYAVCLFAFFAALTAPACKIPPPTTPVGHVIACGTEAVRQCAVEVVAPVNTCLAGTGDVFACITGLIQPAGCLIEDVIACAVRHQGAEFNAAAQVNPEDVRSFRAAERAKEFLEGRAYKFADGSP